MQILMAFHKLIFKVSKTFCIKFIINLNFFTFNYVFKFLINYIIYLIFIIFLYFLFYF